MRKAMWIVVGGVFVLTLFFSGNPPVAFGVAVVVLLLWLLAGSMTDLGRIEPFRVRQSLPEETNSVRRPVADDDEWRLKDE